MSTFCLSSLLRTRPHSLAPVLVCLLSTGVCGWLDTRLCWFCSTQQFCSRRSHMEFKFTSDTMISVIPKPAPVRDRYDDLQTRCVRVKAAPEFTSDRKKNSQSQISGFKNETRIKERRMCSILSWRFRLQKSTSVFWCSFHRQLPASPHGALWLPQRSARVRHTHRGSAERGEQRGGGSGSKWATVVAPDVDGHTSTEQNRGEALINEQRSTVNEE